jgi:hypothetical protein
MMRQNNSSTFVSLEYCLSRKSKRKPELSLMLSGIAAHYDPSSC